MTDYELTLNFWNNKNITSGAELAETLNGHSILFAYNSGKIENEKITYNDTREIFEHDGVTSYTGDLRTLFEMRNARMAHQMFLKSFDERRKFDEDLIKALQLELTQSTYDTHRWQLGERPGEYKHHDYITGREEVGASPEEVTDEMSELMAEMQDVKNENALVATAYFHCKFENIHPFADGNGRVGRLAMNYFLVVHNHPYVVIHEEDRKEYYAALEAWDREQVLEPMCEFLRTQTVKTWKKQVCLKGAGGPVPKCPKGDSFDNFCSDGGF